MIQQFQEESFMASVGNAAKQFVLPFYGLEVVDISCS